MTKSLFLGKALVSLALVFAAAPQTLVAVPAESLTNDTDIAALFNAAGIGSCSSCCGVCPGGFLGKACKAACAKAYSGCSCS